MKHGPQTKNQQRRMPQSHASLLVCDFRIAFIGKPPPTVVYDNLYLGSEVSTNGQRMQEQAKYD